MFSDTYWSIYRRIEKEVLELSYNVFFDDNQIYIYSSKILDLILRINTNIESLYEDIYRNKVYEDMKENKDKEKIGLRIKKIEKLYLLEDKIIHISNENFHFQGEMKTIKPFGYEKHDENDFYVAYCALKHDRRENIRKANINILLRSLAAFYALCVIFDDRCIPLQNSIYGNKIPHNFAYNSGIFSANVYDDQLDYAQQMIVRLANYNKMNNIIDYRSAEEMLQQCEKNLNIKFHEQSSKECLFAAKLTTEYIKKLDRFKGKYSKNDRAQDVEYNLFFGNHANEETFEELNIDNFDVLMDHIKLNLEKSITNIVVNHY